MTNSRKDENVPSKNPTGGRVPDSLAFPDSLRSSGIFDMRDLIETRPYGGTERYFHNNDSRLYRAFFDFRVLSLYYKWQEGNMSTKEFNLSGFSRISVKFAMEIEIVRSDSYSVSVSGNVVHVNNINMTQEGDRLAIGYNINLASIVAAPFFRIHTRIALPELRELNISGAARGSVKGFNSPNEFALCVSGASRLDISEMSIGDMKWDLSGASGIKGQIKAAGNVDIHVAGASRIDLKGSARDIIVDATGASHIDLGEFPAHNARFKLTGASHSIVNLDGKLDVSLDGASRVEYDGQPTMGEVRVTGASSLKHR